MHRRNFLEIHMKKTVCQVLLGLVSSAALIGNAQAQSIPNSTAPAPVLPTIFKELQTEKISSIFKSQVELSGITRENLRGDYVTLLVPEEGNCNAGGDAGVKGSDVESAKAYILRHAFKGQLAVYRVDGHLVSVNYFPEVNSVNSRIRIDENHPFAIPLLDGNSVLVSVRKNAVLFGSNAVMASDLGGLDGAIIAVDHCAVY